MTSYFSSSCHHHCLLGHHRHPLHWYPKSVSKPNDKWGGGLINEKDNQVQFSAVRTLLEGRTSPLSSNMSSTKEVESAFLLVTTMGAVAVATAFLAAAATLLVSLARASFAALQASASRRIAWPSYHPVQQLEVLAGRQIWHLQQYSPWVRNE